MQPGFKCSSVLQKSEERPADSLLPVFCTHVLHLQSQVLNSQPPSGNVALTTGTPSGTED